MADNKDKKVLKSSIEREQSQTCLNSAEREKIKGSTNLNVPHLRFPEFSGEWEKCKLGDIAPLQRGFDLPTHQLEVGTNPVVYSNGIMNYHSSYKCKAPGLVTGRSGTIGKFTFISNGYYWPHNTSLWVTDFNGNIPEFIYYLYQTIKIEQYATGSGVPTLNRNDVHRHKVCVPHTIEQSKIAELFMLLDERIATQNKIIEKLESLIKGIIYQTKSIGLAHNTWQKTELKNVLQERNEKNANGYDVCSVSVTQGVVNQIEYLGRSFAAKDTLHYNVVKYGDIVYTKSPTGDFPYGIVKRSNIKCDVAVSPLYGVYKPVNDYVGIILHFYFMQSNNAINYLHPLIQKGAKNTINITNGRFLENTIPLPKKEEETKCLAWVLTSIQNKIILEQDLLHSYQKQKQYLLRQMFI